MDIYKNLDDIDYNAMAKEIELLSHKDEKELYKSIGVAIAKEKRAGVDMRSNNETSDGKNLKRSVISDEEEGARYWEQFEKNVKIEICSNDIFKNIFANMESLSENLKPLTEALLIALGIVAPSIAVISAICVLVALIIKVGYKTYCELEIVAES